ncbi:MAG TPA: BON domain-containing protein [Nitrospirales bacterium]
MRIRIAVVSAALGLLAGCEWVSTAVRTGIDVGVMLAADRSVYNVMDDYSIKSEITTLIVDEALILNISSDVYQGMVMLTGAVKEEKDKRKAEKLVQQVKGVREVFNEIQVTDDGGVAATVKDLILENKLKAKLVFSAGVSSINFRWRAVNSVIYFMGMAASRQELDHVIALARMEGVQKIVSHVFLTDKFVYDGAPTAPIEQKVEVPGVKPEKKIVTAESEAVKKKPVIEDNAAYEKAFPRRLPPGVPPEMPTYYDRPLLY